MAIWYAVAIAVGLPPEARFLVYGFAGAGLIVLAAYPTRSTVVALVLGACLLLPLHVSARGTLERALAIEPGFLLAYTGLAGIVLLAVRALRRPVPGSVLAGAIGIPTFILLTEPFHTLVIRATPQTLDPALHRIDVALFGGLTFATGRLLTTNEWLRISSVWCYAAMALVGAGVYALALRGKTGRVRPADLLWVWAAAGAIGALFYPLVPAVGPRWVFPEWPWHMPAPVDAYATPSAAVPRNAMPSLHAAWALLICWGAREAPSWMKALLIPWLVLTLIATLGIGGHYLIDLVAALPLACVAVWVGGRIAARTFGESRTTCPSRTISS